jgi:hypothetical protein
MSIEILGMYSMCFAVVIISIFNIWRNLEDLKISRRLHEINMSIYNLEKRDLELRSKR